MSEIDCTIAKTDVMVIGGGGREHAIIKKLKESEKVGIIYALPGNGGMLDDAVAVDIAANDIPSIVRFAVEKHIGFAVVAPDDPLVAGAVDALHAANVKCFGPQANAAIIEGSKVFSKDLMKRYGIPTAKYASFSDLNSACQYIDTQSTPIVVKADGLALGKGVIIASTLDEAKTAVKAMMQNGMFGKSGRNVVIEEFMDGVEVSVLCFTDGRSIAPMVSSMDHKRAFDNDEGLNTGGMGTIAPNPYYTDQIAEECMHTIFRPTVDAMNAEGRTFKGCLYFGLMLTSQGPKVVEYNCRFGDPETQVVLPLLKSDLFDVMNAVEDGVLNPDDVKWKSGAACCVVVASNGYPLHYEKGYEISIDADIDADVFFAGAKDKGGKLVTNGGRVLGVTATADTLEAAVAKAYDNVTKVHFENAYFRHDIGAKAIKVLK